MASCVRMVYVDQQMVIRTKVQIQCLCLLSDSSLDFHERGLEEDSEVEDSEEDHLIYSSPSSTMPMTSRQDSNRRFQIMRNSNSFLITHTQNYDKKRFYFAERALLVAHKTF